MRVLRSFAAALALALFAIPLVGCAAFNGRAAAPDEAGDTPAAPPDRPVVPAAGPTVLVHFDSTYAARIVRLGERYEVVERCDAPCDRALPVEGNYRIDGPEIRSTWPFRLEASGAPGERLVLTVAPSLRSTYKTGKTLGTVGEIAMGVGIALLLGGALVATGDQDANNGGPKACSACDAAFVSGAIIGVGGAIVGVVGLVMGASNLSSDAAQRTDVVKQAVLRF